MIEIVITQCFFLSRLLGKKSAYYSVNRIGNSWKLRRSVDKTPLDPNLYSFENENNKKSIYIQQITAQSTTFSVQHGNTCFKKKKDILIFLAKFLYHITINS